MYSRVMELTISGHPSFHIEGTVTVELPDWMRLLPQHELEEAAAAENRNGLILAAGRHPEGDIVFLTGVGELKELKWEESGLPRLGYVFPIDFGQTIRIEVNNHRSIEVSNLWSIDNAHSLLFFGSMVEPDGNRVSYVQE